MRLEESYFCICEGYVLKYIHTFEDHRRMPESSKVTGKLIREKFYTLAHEENCIWKCKCGVLRKQSGSSYTNLVSHVQTQHPESCAELLRDFTCANSTSKHVNEISVLKIFYGSKIQNLFGWIDLVVNGLLPFTSYENEPLVKHVKYGTVSYTTLMKYMSCLTRSV